MQLIKNKDRAIGWSFLITLIVKPIIDLFWQANPIFNVIKFIWLPYAIMPLIILLTGMHAIKNKKYELILLGFISISFITTWLRGNGQSIDVYVRICGAMLPVLFFNNIVEGLDKEDIVLFFKLYIWSLMLPCFIAFMQLAGAFPRIHKYVGTAGYSMQNSMIAYFWPALFASIYLAFNQKKYRYLVVGSLFLFWLLAANMMTVRIFTLLALVIIVFAYLGQGQWVKLKNILKVQWLFSIPIIGAAIGIVVKFDINISNRNWVWRQYVNQLREDTKIIDILFGRGKISLNMPHNSWLGIFSWLGILVLVAYLFLIRKYIKECLINIEKHEQKWLLRGCLLSSVLGWYLNAMTVTLSYYMIMEWTGLLWIIMASIIVKSSENEQGEKNVT